MPRPRTPKAKAAVTGRDRKNKARFEDRAEPVVSDPIGEPPVWVVDTEKSKDATAWRTFVKELPWLNGSHRALLEIASAIRGRLMVGDLPGVQALNLLRQCLGQMGATPADASKAGATPDGQKSDPADEFFDE